RAWLQNHRAAAQAPTSSDAAPGSDAGHSAANSSVVIGGNVDLGGVQEYQGEVAIAVNPINSNQLVAGANTFFPDPKCQPPSGSDDGPQALYGSSDGGVSWTYACAPWPSSLTQGNGPVFF